MVCCDQQGHRDQIDAYPVGTVVENFVSIAAVEGSVPIGSRGHVASHCADGRAYVFFDGHSEGHTFHGPDKYLRIVSKPETGCGFAQAWAEAPQSYKRLVEMEVAEFFYLLGARDGHALAAVTINADLKEAVRVAQERITR